MSPPSGGKSSRIPHAFGERDSVQEEILPGRGREFSLEGLPEEWQSTFAVLQTLVCELLLKNEQLRMALARARAKESEGNGGPKA